MSIHIWNIRKMELSTVQRGMTAFRFALHMLADWQWIPEFTISDQLRLALKTTGYTLERDRQGGAIALTKVQWYRWESRGFLFAQGKNADNYLRAGHLVLRNRLEELNGPSFKVETPPEVMYDWLLEHHREELELKEEPPDGPISYLPEIRRVLRERQI